MFVTNEDLIKAKLKAEGFDNPKLIKTLIDNHDTTMAENGLKYFYNKQNVSNGINTKNIVNHPFYKMLVMQKVNYLMSKPMNITYNNDELIEIVNDILGDDFNEDIHELGKKASTKGSEWMHIFIDEDSEFNYIIIDSENIIPLYKTGKKKDELEFVIVYYEINTPTGLQKNIELWTEVGVYYYIQNDKGEIIEENKVVTYNEDGEPINSNFEYHYTMTVNGEIINKSWNKVPFIEFKNNREGVYDLQEVKSLIDQYDKTISNRADNFDKIIDALMIIKGYNGDDPKNLVQSLKKNKFLLVSEDGGVEYLTVELPVDATEKQLNRLEENIFLTGVNPSSDKFGNNPSGISLKFLYQELDRKAEALNLQFQKSLRKLNWFITKYIFELTGKVYSINDIEYSFNKTMIVNDKEIIENLNASRQYISEKTYLNNHPYIDNVDMELEQIESEKQQNSNKEDTK